MTGHTGPENRIAGMRLRADAQSLTQSPSCQAPRPPRRKLFLPQKHQTHKTLRQDGAYLTSKNRAFVALFHLFVDQQPGEFLSLVTALEAASCPSNLGSSRDRLSGPRFWWLVFFYFHLLPAFSCFHRSFTASLALNWPCWLARGLLVLFSRELPLQPSTFFFTTLCCNKIRTTKTTTQLKRE